MATDRDRLGLTAPAHQSRCTCRSVPGTEENVFIHSATIHQALLQASIDRARRQGPVAKTTTIGWWLWTVRAYVFPPLALSVVFLVHRPL